MNLSKKTLNTIGIICTILATIMLILVIVVPILLKRKLSNDFIEKCNPSLENTNIWATFPGELESKLLHTFKFFDYQETDDKENPLKINLPYNPAILLLGIYPQELKAKSQNDICTPMFLVALFIIAKRWKQPKCPLIDEWIKNTCTYAQWNITQSKKRMR